jgi:hypothetical protein
MEVQCAQNGLRALTAYLTKHAGAETASQTVLQRDDAGGESMGLPLVEEWKSMCKDILPEVSPWCVKLM